MMALPSKKQFTHFLVQFWRYVTQEVSKHPALSALSDTLLDCVTEKGALEGQKLEAFFEENAYRQQQKKLRILLNPESKEAKQLKKALEQLRLAFQFVKNPLPFEAVEHVLPFADALFEVQAGYLRQIHLTVEDFETNKQRAMLQLTGIKKYTESKRIRFVAAPGTTPQQLFHRAFLECDPRFPVAFRGGTQQDCETLALLCMLHGIPWQCTSYALTEALALETALEGLRKKRLDLSDPTQVYAALGTMDPRLQSYYQTQCLALDKRKLDEWKATGREEYKEEKSRSTRSATTASSTSSSSSTTGTSSPTRDFRFPSPPTESTPPTRDFPLGWQRPRKERATVEEVIEEIDTESDSDSPALGAESNKTP